MWRNGIGSILGALGCRFDSLPGTVGSGSSVAVVVIPDQGIPYAMGQLPLQKKMKYSFTSPPPFFFLVFSGPQPQHIAALGRGFEAELELPASATATEMLWL